MIDALPRYPPNWSFGGWCRPPLAHLPARGGRHRVLGTPGTGQAPSDQAGREKAGGVQMASRLPHPCPSRAHAGSDALSKVAILATTAKGQVKVSGSRALGRPTGHTGATGWPLRLGRLKPQRVGQQSRSHGAAHRLSWRMSLSSRPFFHRLPSASVKNSSADIDSNPPACSRGATTLR